MYRLSGRSIDRRKAAGNGDSGEGSGEGSGSAAVAGIETKKSAADGAK